MNSLISESLDLGGGSDFSGRSFDSLLEGGVENDIYFDIKRIVFKVSNNNIQVITVDKSNFYKEALFDAACSAIGSEWFRGLKHVTQLYYCRTLRRFFEWVECERGEIEVGNSCTLFKDYERSVYVAKSVNSSPLGLLNKVVMEGVTGKYLNESQVAYLMRLVRVSEPKKFSVKSKQVTLSDWFSGAWLSSVLKDSECRELESSKRILLSFRVSISVVLLNILEIRKIIQIKERDFPKLSGEIWWLDWISLMLHKYSRFDVFGRPIDILTELMCCDVVKPKFYNQFCQRVSSSVSSGNDDNFFLSIPKRFWYRPVLFNPSFFDGYSELEELLMSWLCACEAIQPAYINMLKVSDYAKEYSDSGRLTAMQCSYYKGRSGGRKDLEYYWLIIYGRKCWTYISTVCRGKKSISILL